MGVAGLPEVRSSAARGSSRQRWCEAVRCGVQRPSSSGAVWAVRLDERGQPAWRTCSPASALSAAAPVRASMSCSTFSACGKPTAASQPAVRQHWHAAPPATVQCCAMHAARSCLHAIIQSLSLSPSRTCVRSRRPLRKALSVNSPGRAGRAPASMHARSTRAAHTPPPCVCSSTTSSRVYERGASIDSSSTSSIVRPSASTAVP